MHNFFKLTGPKFILTLLLTCLAWLAVVLAEPSPIAGAGERIVSAVAAWIFYILAIPPAGIAYAINQPVDYILHATGVGTSPDPGPIWSVVLVEILYLYLLSCILIALYKRLKETA